MKMEKSQDMCLTFFLLFRRTSLFFVKYNVKSGRKLYFPPGHAMIKPSDRTEETALLTIGEYSRPQSLDEAYALCQKKNNVVLGGMLWLKMQHRRVGTAIDLCDLGLDRIEETADAYRIGAMVPLRALETHAGLAALADFAALPCNTRDILTQIILPKTGGRTVYLSQRNISTDFSVLTCALSERNGAYTCVIGARPMPAAVFADEKGVLAQGITEDSARAFAEDIAARAVLGGNMRASARCWCAARRWRFRRRDKAWRSN